MIEISKNNFRSSTQLEKPNSSFNYWTRGTPVKFDELNSTIKPIAKSGTKMIKKGSMIETKENKILDKTIDKILTTRSNTQKRLRNEDVNFKANLTVHLSRSH